eukprot:TRINITY_DN14051_c0_g1_i1.p1 TRINITY_DN14051_c0_g1~~TRINITY_DN14051_c0_g1_i1.p1  ORF type:complete len:124 (+),score=17.23 TRINITY_DN14051_c0_g1_i1:145-516(+)
MGCTSSTSTVTHKEVSGHSKGAKDDGRGAKQRTKPPPLKVVTAQPPKAADTMTINDSHFPGGARVVPKIAQSPDNSTIHTRRRSKERAESKESSLRISDGAPVVPAPGSRAELEVDAAQTLLN